MSEVQVGMQPPETKPFWRSGAYRKRPVVIQAWRVPAIEPGDPFHTSPPIWIKDALERGVIVPVSRPESDWLHYSIQTLEGDMLAEPDGWVIRGVNGELYPCKADIFEKTYEPA